jgi:hypothetical protein
MIKNFFLDSGEEKIFCSIFGDPKSAKKCIFIFLPLFEERMWSQRVAFNFAVEAAARDNLVIMWDYYGYGESDGDSEDFTLHKCWADTCEIIKYLKSEYEFKEFNLLGIRTGCGIICDILNQGLQNITRIVFWAAIQDLKNFIFNALRSTISTQSYVFKKIVANRDTILNELLLSDECSRGGYILNHIDGYRIGKRFYEEIVALEDMILPQGNNILINYLEIVPSGKHGLLANIKEARQKEFAGRSNISHSIVIDREFWMNNSDYSQRSDKLYAATIEWLEN